MLNSSYYSIPQCSKTFPIIPLSMPDYSFYSIDYSIFSVEITRFINVIFLF